jgi:diguanylate cyclase (GGDEF)-like protein
VLHHVGADPLPILADALAALQGQDEAVSVERTPHGYKLLGCPAYTRFGERAGLVVWRAAGGRAWTGDDLKLAASITGLIRMVMEHESIQRELARQARTDPLTGLLNRRAFLDEAGRRIDRLDREALPGTLLFVDLDRMKLLNDRLGHEAGDAALVLVADLLRRTVRPADLVARLGGDEFALWLDGSDELTAAERAEGLRIGCPQTLAHLMAGQEWGMTMSIGIACRQAGGAEALDSLMQRADQVMYEVKRAGRGHWRVSHAEPAP